MIRVTFVGIILLGGLAVFAQENSLKTLYEQHRWFELRDAIAHQDAPPLYKGAVASAFNDRNTAEQYLKQAIKLAPASAEALDAHEALANLYIRAGRYHEAVQQLREILRIKPGRADAENALKIFAAWSKHGDQEIQSVRLASVHADNDGTLPILIHGQAVHWLLDTGANFSVMSESEAKMLGVKVEGSSARMADLAGGAATMRTAVADELQIGQVRLRNVGFLILPDSREPMSTAQPGHRGIIGLSVIIALQSIAWKADGTFEVGPSSASSPVGNQNLAFDDLEVVTRAEFHGQELDFILDSGDGSGSQLWTRFANHFATLVKQQGTVSKQRIEQFGGSSEREITVLPEMQFEVGGMNAVLRPAQIFSKPVGDDLHDGLLGADILSQAKEGSINFASMSFELRQ